MEQSLLLNIIPFNPPVEEITCHFLTRKPDYENYSSIHKDDVKDQLEGIVDEADLENGQWFYTNFGDAQEGSFELTINLKKFPYFALHYYRYVLREYFRSQAITLKNNFAKDLEVYVLSDRQTSSKYELYSQYTLKLQYARLTDGPELVVSFDGNTKVLKQSIGDIDDYETINYNWVAYKQRIYKWKFLPAEIKNDLKFAFPILSNDIKPHFGITFESPDFSNRYPKYLSYVNSFKNSYLSNETLISALGLAEDFYTPSPDKVRMVTSDGHELQYGRGTGRDPKRDFKYKKPLNPKGRNPNVKFFFIYQKDQKESHIKPLYNWLLNGFPHPQYPFPKMADYISQPFHIAKDINVEFENIEESIQKVKEMVKVLEKDDETTYMAIFVNPVPKSEKDTYLNSFYYRIKETLLYEDIVLQVIKAEHIRRDGELNMDFNTFLPHLQIAILAKLGGVPWLLKREPNQELLVGVGAFYSKLRNERFVGSAFSFDNNGTFNGFDCFKAADTTSLIGSIREAVGIFINKKYTATRLVIHFYKDINKEELKLIMATLHSLGLPIPVVILAINKTESNDYLAFDMNYQGKYMPQSGTVLQVGYREFLLFNNTRYDENSYVRQKEWHFPIKIAISCTQNDHLDEEGAIEKLMDQVYQFSKMYWKSTDQQSLPVTIKYPEMVARIYPHFKYPKLASFGKETLWFL